MSDQRIRVDLDTDNDVFGRSCEILRGQQFTDLTIFCNSDCSPENLARLEETLRGKSLLTNLRVIFYSTTSTRNRPTEPQLAVDSSSNNSNSNSLEAKNAAALGRIVKQIRNLEKFALGTLPDYEIGEMECAQFWNEAAKNKSMKRLTLANLKEGAVACTIRLALAIRSLTDLSLTESHVGSRAIDELCRWFESTMLILDDLYIGDCKYDINEVPRLVRSVRMHEALTGFHLWGQGPLNMDCAMEFKKLIAEHKRLSYLRLYCGFCDEGLSLITEAVKGNYKVFTIKICAKEESNPGMKNAQNQIKHYTELNSVGRSILREAAQKPNEPLESYAAWVAVLNHVVQKKEDSHKLIYSLVGEFTDCFLRSVGAVGQGGGVKRPIQIISSSDQATDGPLTKKRKL
jgi:hypothetical protein